MRPRNIIAVFQGDAAAEAVGAEVDKRFKVLKKHEIRNFGSFCAIIQQKGCSMAHFDVFFVSYHDDLTAEQAVFSYTSPPGVKRKTRVDATHVSKA